MRRSWVLLLSSCSARGDVCCTSSWVSFCASSCGACGFPRRVLPQVPLGGYLTFLAQDACPAPAVELCLWGLRYLSCGACLALCRALFPPPVVYVASLPPVTLQGFCPFWPCLPALLLHWWRVLGCHPALVFSGLFLHRLPCRCSLDSAPCVRGLPLWLSLLLFHLCGGALWLPKPLGLCWLFCHLLLRFSASVGGCAMFSACFHLP